MLVFGPGDLEVKVFLHIMLVLVGQPVKQRVYQSDRAKDIFSVSVKVRTVPHVASDALEVVTVPVPCQHDVIFVKLLPAVVLSRTSVVIAVPAPRLLSANGGVEPTAAF